MRRKHIVNNSALVVIDLQNDITKNYKEIIERVNQAIDWALGNEIAKVRKNNSKQSIMCNSVRNQRFSELLCPTCPYSSDTLWVTVWVSQSCHSAKVGALGTF